MKIPRSPPTSTRKGPKYQRHDQKICKRRLNYRNSKAKKQTRSTSLMDCGKATHMIWQTRNHHQLAQIFNGQQYSAASSSSSSSSSITTSRHAFRDHQEQEICNAPQSDAFGFLEYTTRTDQLARNSCSMYLSCEWPGTARLSMHACVDWNSRIVIA